MFDLIKQNPDLIEHLYKEFAKSQDKYGQITYGDFVNLEQFKQKIAIAKLDNIDIHKDNPSVLYYDDITRDSNN